MRQNPSSRTLRECGGCGKRKNLAWDKRGEVCHDCLLKRRDYVIKQHKENHIPYHEAESELMERMGLSRLEAEEMIHPKKEEWKHPARKVDIKIGEEVVKFDEEGNLLLSDGRTIPLGGDGEVSE